MAQSEAKSEAKSSPNSPRAVANSPRAVANSPKATSPKAATEIEIDTSLLSWVTNTHSVLHWPLTILSVIGLIVLGSFVEIAPRKSLEFLDNPLGSSLFFIIPFLISILIDWPTGLLAATVSLIIFARLQRQDPSEGFSDVTDTNDISTKLISSPHRWFIERVLGESPLAISSDRINTKSVDNTNIRSSSSSMSNNSMSNNSMHPDTAASSFSHK
jgi:hypothetical protein